MFELITIAIFIWLLAKCISLAFRLTWGVAKIAASVLLVLAMPALILCLLFASGLALLLPLLLVLAAAGILKACVS